jgi:hypothetical protein
VLPAVELHGHIDFSRNGRRFAASRSEPPQPSKLKYSNTFRLFSASGRAILRATKPARQSIWSSCWSAKDFIRQSKRRGANVIARIAGNGKKPRTRTKLQPNSRSLTAAASRDGELVYKGVSTSEQLGRGVYL